MSRGKCVQHKPLLWGDPILMWLQEGHAKQRVRFITFYPTDGCPNSHNETSLTLSMNHCPVKSTFINVFSHSADHFTYANKHLLNQVPSVIRNYFCGNIHFSTILYEDLHHLLVPIACCYVQRSGTILRNVTCSENTNTEKRMVREQVPQQ